MTTENTQSTAKESAAGVSSAAVASGKASSKKAGSSKVTPNKQKSTKGNKPKAAKARKIAPAKTAKTAKPLQPKIEGVREGSKTATILELLHRAKGATLADIMEATSWQAHSVRGFISGTLGKRMGLTVNSAKREDGTRVYSIAK
jgi:hypothetical protein